MLVIPGNSQNSYNLSRSLRLRSSASAYLSRTFSTPTDNRIWTLSSWIKIGTPGYLFSAGTDGSNYCSIYNFSGGLLIYNVSGGTATLYASTTVQMRDYSSWYHIVFAIDTTQATASNRVKIYINGVSVPVTLNVTPSQNMNPIFNGSGVQHQIGCTNLGAPANFYDGLIAETHFIDGQALGASNFGNTNPFTNIWQPKKYTGSYGNTGYYLSFINISNVSALGSDQAYLNGVKVQNNFWTVNNVSLTAGSTYDSFTDVPTLTSSTISNYATLNPLKPNPNRLPINGNLRCVSNASSWAYASSTLRWKTGKFYFEVTAIDTGNAAGDGGASLYCWDMDNGTTYSSPNILGVGSLGVYGVAFDSSARTITYFKSNIVQTTYTNITQGEYDLGVSCGNGPSLDFNFGQQPFIYTPPSDHVALNSYNLPDPPIKISNKYFDVSLWNGNSGSQSIVNAGGFAPDMIWTKSRSDTQWYNINDTARGGNVQMYTNATNAETAASGTIAFTSTGFNLVGYDINNKTGNNYVGWQWKKGATPGFDIVLYNGSLSSPGTADISHSLGIPPAMIIYKSRSNTSDWLVRHKSLTSWNYGLFLELSNAALDTSSNGSISAPTSSTFPINYTSASGVNGYTYVAYLWSEITGFSKFNSYVGNSLSDGPFVYCGFRPRFIMIKASTTSSDWVIHDTARDPSNLSVTDLYPYLNNAENTVSSLNIDILSNGFKLRGPVFNNSGHTYIFAAFAETPFKYSLAR